MRFLRFGEPGEEQPAVVHGDRVHSLAPLTHDIDGAFLASGGLRAAADAAEAGLLPEVDVDGKRIAAPIARPGAVICIGMNYAAHAAESGSAPPSAPVVFFKHPSTVVGPYDDVHLPPGSDRTDWEVELGLVVGRRAHYLPDLDSALACVAGYVVSNDVSEREFQLDHSGGQWSKGKSCQTFNPLGPELVPAWEVANPQDLHLRSTVNGEIRQDSSTADMIFSVAFLIWHLSHYMAVEPGDLVNTGTPEGVALSGRFPYLGVGDVMELEISGLGVQRQRVVPAPIPEFSR